MAAGGDNMARRWLRGAGMLYLCIRGPRLYRVYRLNRGRAREEGENQASWESFYQPKALEKHTDSIMAWVSVLWTISYYSSPLAAFYMYRKGYITANRLVPLGQYGMTLLFLLAGVACLRGIGRWTNPQYIQFISILQTNRVDNCPENKKLLSNYNFDFRHWPVDFRWDDTSSKGQQDTRPSGGAPLLKPEPRTRGAADSVLHRVQKLPCQVISYVVANSFGRRMLYPGSVYLLQKALMPMLLQGQARLMEEYHGKRAKLLACDNNEIDTIFVDRRRSGHPNGAKLVICCEGNAGFYEVGCVSTPLEAGYSVLGWNHPGFAGSTGVPFPQNEANAMDVVVQYAVYRLGFQLEDIIVYAWSIGGFTGGLVTRTVRKYLNLNNSEQLCRYQGPVLLIRRTNDEIITTTQEDISSNRGNDLLLSLLQSRYPNVMTEEGRRAVRLWLAAATPEQEASVLSQYGVEEDWCLSVLQSYKAESSGGFPWSVGEEMNVEGRQQLALYLAQKHLQNFEATHCTPLPPNAFHLPWSV
ncbi:phosphatidylserine lipase ABHD16A isoform X2 [Hyperolius riggenbachi]|uniref:phosphatidylserine lipase ABHD16A isoform X2 n=1 Tax=Hyperolius riggenbachi TaxID=752182 RepID=UPI0035A348DB